LSGPCLIVSSGKRNGIILLLSSSINAHTYISLYLLGANVTSLNEFPIYSHCFSAFLVLNTLRKMYKTEFCLNNHTNGRNTKIIYVDTPSVPITASAGQSWFADIPFTKQDGYIPISATINCTGGNSQAYIIGIHQLTNGSVRVAFQNYSGSPQTINISAKVVLIKQT